MKEDISNTWKGKALLVATKTGHVVIHNLKGLYGSEFTNVYASDSKGVVQNWNKIESKPGNYLNELVKKYEYIKKPIVIIKKEEETNIENTKPEPKRRRIQKNS